jgi:hypothetical protein
MRYAVRYQVSRSRIAFCDHVVADANPSGFYVLALHSTRRCEGICSTNMGWFAVERSTGRVFAWDVGEQQVGREFRARP